MSLPKIAISKFMVTLPSNKKEIEFRPFLVKEEKVLLMAAEANDEASMIRAIRETINACVEDIDVGKIPYFDVEYLFLNIRAKSVGETVKLKYRHTNGTNRKNEKCDASTDVEIDITKANITFDPTHSSKFMIDDRLGMQMKYPTINNLSTVQNAKDEFAIMASCIDYVYDNTNVYPPDNKEESLQFIESMNSKQFANLIKFFETMPKLKHKIAYTCSGCGEAEEIILEGIADFF